MTTPATPSTANAEQIQHWSDESGHMWVAEQVRMDRMISPLGREAMAPLRLQPGERVLDIGCGCGGTSLELAAAVGPTGAVVGVDVSEPMVGRARERAAEVGVADRVHFRREDAQVATFDAGFDAAFSRFGIMFFDDPVAAFSNVRGALRPGGRLSFICWQPVELNPWIVTIREVASRHMEMPPPPGEGEPGPFSLGDPDRVRQILGDAGFSEVAITDRTGPFVLGEDVDDAADLFSSMGPPPLREVLRAGLKELFQPWSSGGEVAAPSAAWIVSAQG